jgi:hypothetical protein
MRPDVNVTASLDRISSKDGVSWIRGVVTFSNDGPTVLDFFDALYTVTGFSLSPDDHPLRDDGGRPNVCTLMRIDADGWLTGELNPNARTIFDLPADAPPTLTTRFYNGDSTDPKAESIYGILNSRRFTTSAELALPN